MHKLTLSIFLLLATISHASDPKPADYTITIHVSASRIASAGTGIQDLDVIINARKYELISDRAVGQLLALGDYKAKLVEDSHKTTYESNQFYEFLFPDDKTRKFQVVGQSE